MKMKFFYAIALLVSSFGLFSCDKDKDKGNDNDNGSTPTEPTTVSIGGKSYSIVKIGAQSWISANYSGAGGSYFSESAPKTEYGKLYTYAEAMAVTPPAGWRLPTKEDYQTLLQTAGITLTDNKSTDAAAIKKLQSVDGWSAGHKGTNETKFNAFPAGYFAGTGFNAEGDVTVLWTSSKTTGNLPYFLVISKAEIELDTEEATTQKFSVRFVKAN